MANAGGQNSFARQNLFVLFNFGIGLGKSAPGSLRSPDRGGSSWQVTRGGMPIALNFDEFSRLEDDRAVVAAAVVPEPAALTVRFRVELVKARRARDAVVATQHLGLPAGDASLGQVARFDLARLVDSDGLPSVRRGRYLVRATPVGAAGPPVESEDFPVRLLTAHRLATDYLHGLTHLGAEVLSPKYQPRAIAGVEIIEVQPNTQPGFYPLSCNVDASGQRTLKWAGGTTIAIDPRFRRFVLPDNRDGYVEVEIADPQALPDASVEERILIERSRLDPTALGASSITPPTPSTPHATFLEPTLLSTDGRRCPGSRPADP